MEFVFFLILLWVFLSVDLFLGNPDINPGIYFSTVKFTFRIVPSPFKNSLVRLLS